MVKLGRVQASVKTPEKVFARESNSDLEKSGAAEESRPSKRNQVGCESLFAPLNKQSRRKSDFKRGQSQKSAELWVPGGDRAKGKTAEKIK